jgi:glycosyltransferase involved in cell wall biosynthesis
MNPKISVIIPAYNAEKTLRRCLDSVFASDFLDSMEVILVNDGSKDGTLEVAEEYKKHPNFVLIDQPNGGVARARWAGISASRGEYLGFVDADDYIAPDMMSKMYDKAKKNGAEMVVCGWIYVGSKYLYPVMINNERESESGIQAMESIVFSTNSISALWNKIYKRELIDENIYKKTIGMRTGEDALLLISILPNVKKVSYLSEPLYFYVDNPDSVTHTPTLKSLIESTKVQFTLLEAFNNTDYSKWKSLALCRHIKTLSDILRSIDRLDSTSQSESLKKKIQESLRAISLVFVIHTCNKRIFLILLLIKMRMFRFTCYLWDRCLRNAYYGLKGRFIN